MQSKSNPSDFKIRREACRLAAQALRSGETENGYTPRLWSLVVFFEVYLREGAEGTKKDFGPPAPVKLKKAQNVSKA